MVKNLFYCLYRVTRKTKRLIRSCFYCKIFKKTGKCVRFGYISLLVNPNSIIIGNNCRFGDSLTLTAWRNENDCSNKQRAVIEIKDNCNIGMMNHITATNKIILGENLLTGKFVTISDNSHGATTYEELQCPPEARSLISKGSVVIEKNVWIGDKATILGGVTIGEGAVVAANSVVCKNVPAYSVVAGVPAKIIRRNI